LVVASVAVAALGGAGLLVAPNASAISGGGSGTGEVSGEIPIVDGQPSNSDGWVVRILTSDSECSGAVFADLWVLTAKHCVENERGDDIQLNTFLADGTHVTRTIEGVSTRPSADIALIRLARPYLVARNSAGEPVRPRGPVLGSILPQKDDLGVVYGFGTECTQCATRFAVKAGGVRVTANDSEDVRGGPAMSVTRADVPVEYRGGTVLYRGGNAVGGDSGGPMVMNGQIVGIHSSSPDDTTDLVVAVAPHRAWILGIMGF
jgi:hypothetical protein